MSRKSGSSVQKRQRELKRAEKAAQKKERSLEEGEGDGESTGSQVASDDDLAGYGFPIGETDEDEPKD
ncbi:MAG: hypothetical protein JRH10_16350 [Deltaproteobacteria bacterium]|nr:hypothetical protein [Deltaproteobacteria bacterium]MBW2445242.1 hypothetical protein [Deltaproteobacteria bacterium]